MIPKREQSFIEITPFSKCHYRDLKQEETAKKTRRSTGRFPFKRNRGWLKINLSFDMYLYLCFLRR